MKAFFLTLALSVLATTSFAHEGHDDAPGSVKALHGGIVKTGKEMNLEVVSAGGELKLFPVNHAGTDIPLSEIKLTATAQPPKGKAAPIALEMKDNAFYSKLDFKGSYRLSLDIKAEHKGKKDTFKVQVEQ